MTRRTRRTRRTQSGTILSAVAALLFVAFAPLHAPLQAQGQSPARNASASGPASGPVRDSVVAVVQEFFRAMEASDSASAAATIHPDGMTFSTQPRGDSTVLARSPLSRFPASMVSNRSKLVERMWEPTVLVHGGIAVVWAAYDFHIDGKFSHCGVDAFTLARTPAGWRIVNITYTVERTGCAPSPLGPLKRP